MDWVENTTLAVTVLSIVIAGAWFIDFAFGDGPNRKYLARYINGANDALAHLGQTIEAVPVTREATTLEEKQLVRTARAYSTSVSSYRTLAKEFGLRHPAVTVIDSVAFTLDGNAVFALRGINDTIPQYVLIRGSRIPNTTVILKEGVADHICIINLHHWGSRIFKS